MPQQLVLSAHKSCPSDTLLILKNFRRLINNMNYRLFPPLTLDQQVFDSPILSHYNRFLSDSSHSKTDFHPYQFQNSSYMEEYILRYLGLYPTFSWIHLAKHSLRNVTSAIQRTPIQRKTKDNRKEDIWTLHNQQTKNTHISAKKMQSCLRLWMIPLGLRDFWKPTPSKNSMDKWMVLHKVQTTGKIPERDEEGFSRARIMG